MDQNKSSGGGVSQDIKWYAAQEFYGRLHEKMGDFYDHFKAGDKIGALLVYRFLYAETLAYTSKFMKEKGLKEFLSEHDDIEELSEGYKPENTDSETKFNNTILRKQLDLLFKKYLGLQDLMAKAQLNIPLDKTRNDLPAAFARDGK